MDLTHLNPQQLQAVTSKTPTTVVLAGPGSGKTRVLTHRVAWMESEGVDPGRILAVTFTNKAAREMKERLARLMPARSARAVTARTFHSFGAWLLRSEMPVLAPMLARQLLPVGGRKILGDMGGCKLTGRFMIYDAADSEALVREIVGNLNLDTQKFAGPIKQQIEAWKAAGLLPSSPELDAALGHDPALQNAHTAYLNYQATLLNRNALDFTDLMLYPWLLFEWHSPSLDQWRDRFPHILVDESQDTSTVQYALLTALAPMGRRVTSLPSGLPSATLFLVGDEDQAIYGWRYADYRNLKTLIAERQAETQVVILVTNYRSGASIVTAATRLIEHNDDRVEKRLVAHNVAGTVEVVGAPSEDDEAYRVAAMVADAISSGTKPSEIAVLYRAHALSRAIETAFVRSRIAYRLTKGTDYYSRHEVRDTLAVLRVLGHSDVQSFKRVINAPARGLGAKAIESILAAVGTGDIMDWLLAYHQAALPLDQDGAGPAAWKQLAGRHRLAVSGGVAEKVWLAAAVYAGLASAMESEPLPDLIHQIVSMLMPHWAKLGGELEERIGNATELMTVAAHIEGAGLAALTAFLEEVALVNQGDDIDDADVVVLSTFHGAKGLEWDRVFVVAAEEGIVPHERSVQEGGLEEERRLFYVACTRPRQHLTLTLADRRTLYGKTEYRVPSRFLQEMGV